MMDVQKVMRWGKDDRKGVDKRKKRDGWKTRESEKQADESERVVGKAGNDDAMHY